MYEEVKMDHWKFHNTLVFFRLIIPTKNLSLLLGYADSDKYTNKLRREGLNLHRLLARVQHNSCCYVVTSFCNI